MRLPRILLMLLVVLLRLAPGAHALEASDAGEAARQLASMANDGATSLDERQATLQKLQESARLFLDASATVEAAQVLNRVGRLQLTLNAPQDALGSFNKALELLKQTPSLETEVDGLNGLAAAHVFVKNKDEAAQVLQQSLALSAQAGYALGQAQALLTLSELQNYDNHAVALQTAQQALKLWQTLDDRPGLARAYSHVGRCLMAQNILGDAAQNYQLALDLWRELNNPPEQAGALIMLGFIEFRRGEWRSCISLLTEAQGLLDERAEPGKMGQIASGLAAAFNEYGLPETGLAHYQRALSYYRQTQEPRAARYATWGLGCTYYLLGNYTEALSHLQQSLEGVAKDGLDAALSYEYLGRVYAATGDYVTALEYQQSALAIYTKAVNPKEAAQVRGLIGQIYEQQGQPERARENYRQALETFRRLSDRVNEAAIYYALGRLELQGGNYDAAEDYLRQSVEVTENIRRVSTSSDLAAAFSATVHERYEKYIECLMHEHRAQPSRQLDALAFETSELARARSLTELLRATQTNLVPGLEPELAAREKSLRQSLRIKEDYKVALLGRAYQTEELAALEAGLARLEADYKQVTDAISARYPAFKQLTRPAAWGVRQIQEQVIADDQTVLLEYSLGADKSYVWAVTRDGVTSYELPAQARINEAAQKVYKALATAPDSDAADTSTAAAQELSRMILSPVAAQLNKRRVIVVADGVLNYVPFQVLPSPSAKDEPLVARYEVVNAPSASILGELRQEAARRQPAAKMLAAFGNPVFASNYAQLKDADGGAQLAAVQPLLSGRWQARRDIELNGDSFNPSLIQPLFYARRELTNLRDVAAGSETFVASDFAATRQQLLGADLSQYAILHFATHGLLDPKRPENSGLVLSTVNRDGQAQNGFVGLRDIYELRAPVELVVLSACQTALGKDVRGEGLIGLTRGFMYAGASSVVASLWKVDDEATAELMRQFYTNMLQKQMTPAAALRAAQNGIRQRPEWRAPYYWAAFTLQGDYRQIIGHTPPARFGGLYLKILVSGAMLTLLAGGVWIYRRRRGWQTARRSV